MTPKHEEMFDAARETELLRDLEARLAGLECERNAARCKDTAAGTGRVRVQMTPEDPDSKEALRRGRDAWKEAYLRLQNGILALIPGAAVAGDPEPLLALLQHRMAELTQRAESLKKERHSWEEACGYWRDSYNALSTDAAGWYRPAAELLPAEDRPVSFDELIAKLKQRLKGPALDLGAELSVEDISRLTGYSTEEIRESMDRKGITSTRLEAAFSLVRYMENADAVKRVRVFLDRTWPGHKEPAP